jgi:hypothetical protein
MTAQITGTPTTPGSYSFTAKVTDANNLSGTANLTLVVGGALIIDCNSCITGTRLPTGNPGVPYNAMLTVSGGVAPYTWCVLNMAGTACDPTQSQLPIGLTLSTDSNGDAIISGTPTNVPAAPPAFTLQVTDSEVPAAVSTIPLTMTIIGIVTPSLPPGTIYAHYSQSMTVAGGVVPYTWSITSGTLPPGLSLGTGCVDSRQPSCTISGTPTLAGNYPITVQVTDSEHPAAVATAQLSISVAGITNGALNGSYIFSFSGYSSGTPVIMAGAFAADGNGNITSGELDLNNGLGEPTGDCGSSHDSPQQQAIMPAPGSTYSLQASGQGLGTLTIVTSSATYSFAISIRADGSGSLIQNNADPDTRGSGVIKVQTPGIGTGQLQANFAVGLSGADPSGSRYVAAGQLAMEDGQGDFAGPALDVDNGGVASQHVFAGTVSTTIDSFGRGCFANITFDHMNNDVYVYTYYIVSADQLVILSTDPVGGSKDANLTLWSLERQIVGASGFNNASLAAPNVVGLSARDASGAADVTTGLFVGQGSSAHNCEGGQFDNATFTFDENQGGTLSEQQSSSGQYCVDQSTGRVTLQNFSGAWATNPPVFYLGGNDPGSVVGTDIANTSGSIEGQSGSPFTNGSLNGGYWGGTFLPAISGITDSVASLYSDGAGNMIGTQYISGPGGPGGPNSLTFIYSVDSTGRAVVQQNGHTYGIAYVVAVGSTQFQSKFVLLPAGNDPALNVFLGPPLQ